METVNIGGRAYRVAAAESPLYRRAFDLTSDAGRVYRVGFCRDGSARCTCPAFMYRKRRRAPCKHLIAVFGMTGARL